MDCLSFTSCNHNYINNCIEKKKKELINWCKGIKLNKFRKGFAWSPELWSNLNSEAPKRWVIVQIYTKNQNSPAVSIIHPFLLPDVNKKIYHFLNLGSHSCCARYFLFPTHSCLVWFQRRRPWFTNSEGRFQFPELLASRVDVLIDEMLPRNWNALLSMSKLLLVQKSSDILGFATVRALNFFCPFSGSSTDEISLRLISHPRQPLLPCMQ